MSPRKPSTTYGHGHIRKTAYGTFAADLARGRGGARLRRTFATRLEAEAWLDAQASADLPPLTAAQMREAAEAFARLPEGVSLTQALDRGLGAIFAPHENLRERVADYLAEASKRLRPDTLAQYRRQLSLALASPILGADLAAYTKSALLRYLDAIPSQRAKTKALRSLSALLSWLVARDLIPANPASSIKAPRIPKPTPSILTIPQAAHLLRVANDFDGGSCLPYVAVCLFAGLRPTEAMRLRVSDIDGDYIKVASAQAKTVTARTVPIRPNLRAILTRCEFSGDSILPCSQDRFRKRLTALIKASGLSWTQDVLRHTFASYAYEVSRDAAATAYEMGHRGTDVFFRHYRAFVAPGDGQRFFGLL